MEQSDCLKCFLTKTGVGGLKALIKELTTQDTGTVRTVRGRPLPSTSNNRKEGEVEEIDLLEERDDEDSERKWGGESVEGWKHS